MAIFVELVKITKADHSLSYIFLLLYFQWSLVLIVYEGQELLQKAILGSNTPTPPTLLM